MKRGMVQDKNKNKIKYTKYTVIVEKMLTTLYLDKLKGKKVGLNLV